MKYELWYEPYIGVPFEEFSKEQAEEYFQCHMSQVDHRIEVLARYGNFTLPLTTRRNR